MAAYTATRKGPQKLYGFYGNGNGATYTITVINGTGKLNKYDVNRRPIRGGMASVIATGGAGGAPLTYTEPARFDFELEVWADVSTAGTFTITITSTNSGDNVMMATFSDGTGTALLKPDGSTFVLGTGYTQPLIYYSDAYQKYKAGTADLRIGIAGNSIASGAYGNGTVGAPGTVNIRQYSLANQLTALFTAAGESVNIGNTWGDQNYSSALGTNLYDPSVTLQAGWIYSGNGSAYWSLGGNWCSVSAGTGRYRFTPPANTNGADFYFLTDLTYGAASLAVDGTAAIVNYNTAIATGLGVQSVSTTLGAHTWDAFKQVTGDGKAINIVGIDTYDTTKKQIRIYNTAIGAATIQNWSLATAGYNLQNAAVALGCHLWIIPLTVNEANNALASATIEPLYQQFHDAVTAAGADVIFVAEYPIGTANGLANQARISRSIAKIAAANNRRLVNVYTAEGSFALLQAKNWFPAGELIHGNNLLLVDSATKIFAALTP